MDMVGVSIWLIYLYSHLFTWDSLDDESNPPFDLLLQNVLPQILNEGASEDRGEIARLVSILTF